MSVARVELFSTGPECTLCERAWDLLLALHRELEFEAAKIEIDEDTVVPPDYVIRVPVIHVDGRAVIEGRIDPTGLAAALRAAGVPPIPR